MDAFLHKHSDDITGVLSCPDRVLFKGYLPFGYPEAMERFLTSQGLLLKDFKAFCEQQSEEVKAHAKMLCRQLGRPYEYLGTHERKEDLARSIAERDHVVNGLVCVFATLESSASFKLRYAEGRPRLISTQPRCLCLYFYFMDPDFGFMHVRMPTWFPFTIQVYVNGHSWLARKMDRHGLDYSAVDNAFTHIGDSKRAQRFADRFVKLKWPRILEAFARKVNPLLKGFLAGYSYYWVTDQFEYATDVMFKGRNALEGLYKKLLDHATLCFSAEDVLFFLGRKLNGNFKGDVINDRKKRRQGARVKHRMKENWIKMYDKFGSVLRIETVINRPYEFRVRREGMRRGEKVTAWFPMAKGVANLPRYGEVCLAANRRYLQALAVVDNPAEALRELPPLAKPVRKKGKSNRGFNPLSLDDVRLFSAVLRGEHFLHGFRNRDIRQQLFPHAKHPKLSRRQSARISRLLHLLHVHRLIAKIPRSRRWRVTDLGHKLMTAVISLFHQHYPDYYAQCAA